MANMGYAVGQPFQALSHLEGDFYGLTTAGLNSGQQTGDYPTTNPVTNVVNEHLVKSFSVALEITFDLGTGVNPAAVLIEGLNFADSIQVENGATSGLGTNVGSPVAPVRNKRTGRYSCFIEIPSVTDKQHWGFSVPATGAVVPTEEFTPGWQVGRVTWIREGGLHTMPQNWHLPVGQATQYEGAQRVLAGGKMESKASSQGFNVIDLTAQFDRNKGDNIEDDIGAMARTSPEDRYLTWFNRGDVSEAYLCTKIDFSGNLDEFPAISVDMGLREVV